MQTNLTDQPIGVFDSGLGGLTVVQELWRELPQEQIIYFGDTARVPYGSRSPEEIIEFNAEIIEFLLAEKVKIIVFACNTSTSLALDAMRQRYPVPMFGIIQPGAKAALATTQNKRIGLMATEATVRSGAYRYAIHDLDSQAVLIEQACPKLVPLIEKGEIVGPETSQALGEYLLPLQQGEVDTIIYGCTHYPFLEPEIKRIFPQQFQLVNPACSCAQEVREYLKQNRLTAQEKPGEDRYFVSGDPGKFQQLGTRLINRLLTVPQKVDVFSPGPLKIVL